jgi:hypothetical protein
MPIDKGLYAAPVGLEQGLADDAAELEIEIVDPEAVNIEMDGMEISLRPGEETAEDFNANLAEFMDETELRNLSSDLVALFDKDIADRSDWAKTYVEGIKLLGLKYEERTEPWEDACGVFHPMLTESVVRFQSEAMMETFPAAGPVKTQIMGAIDKLKEDAATRVREDMNYQLLEVMAEYRAEHEKLLWNLPIAGSAFKKVYYDPSKGRQVAVFIPAEDMVVPYGASTLEAAERVTHVMRKTENEMARLMASGFYRDVDIGEPRSELDDIEKQKAEEQGMDASYDNRYRVLEMHVELDLDAFPDLDKDGEPTGIAIPYVVTIDKQSGIVLAIRRNWIEDDILKLKRQHFVHYQYIPGFGFYGYGLIHLIGGYARSATMLIRQLVDAGTLSNLPGGFKAKGMRVKGDDSPVRPGEWKDVDVPSGTIRDNIMPLPYKEPSQVLYTLFQNIVAEGRAFASAGDMKVSDMSAQAPVGTTLAILERTLKVMTAVQARIHFAMKQEFKLLKAIIRDFAATEYDYDPIEGNPVVRQADYDMVEVIPVSDPNAATMAQKIVQYQAALQLAQTAPQLYDLPLLHRQMIEVLGIKNAAKLVPIEDDATPVDPIQENQNALTGKPLKAFIEQDHEAHLAVHMSFMQDPKMAALIGQSPQGQQIMAALTAHLNEHLAFQYRRRIEEQLGLPMPTEEQEENMEPEVAAQVARLAAEAAKRLLNKHVAEAQMEQAQQQMQDPVLQMQMKELAIKEREVGVKEKKVDIDAQIELERLNIEKTRLQGTLANTTRATESRAVETMRHNLAKEELDQKRMMLEVQKASADATTKRIAAKTAKQPPKGAE